MRNEAVIILTEQGAGEKAFTVSEQQNHLILGRHKDCAICVADASVSGRHGRFYWEDGQLFYVDLGSTNGSFLDGRQIKGAVPVGDGSTLMIAGIKSGVRLRVELAGADSKSQPGDKKMWTVGRDPSCDIVLPYHNVSRFHAKLVKRDGKLYLEDNNSTNGTFVNGARIDKPSAIVPADAVYVASIRLRLQNGVLVQEDARAGLSVQVQNLCREVTEKGQAKTLLDHIHLSIESNEFVAIIGGSGAGKSTLMNVLCGKTAAYKGVVTYNRASAADDRSIFKSAVGYAPQNDVLYHDLTLYQMLYYSARLKMPQDTMPGEYANRVTQVIAQVALTGHENTLVKKLSGGQQKRASIAVELLSDPKLFFLDEPTSGLDPATERNLMRMLKEMTQDNKTIIAVTHVTQNLDLCDKVIVMGAGGRLCFFGAPQEACAFFEVTDIVDIYDKINSSPAVWQQKYRTLTAPEAGAGGSESALGSDLERPALDAASGTARAADALDAGASGSLSAPRSGSGRPARAAKRDRKSGYNSGWSQFLILSARYIRLIVGDPKRLMLLLLQAPVLGVLLMLVSVSSSEDGVFAYSTTAKSTLFSLTCAAFWVGMLNSIQEVCKERDIYERERMSAVRLLPYIASKIAVIGLLCLFQSLVLTLVVRLFVELPENTFGIPPFLGYLVTVCMTTLCAACLGLAVSSLSPNPDRAMAIAPIILLPQIIFSGIVFELTGFMSFISNIIPCKLTMQNFGILTNFNELPVSADSTEKALDAMYSVTDMSRILGTWQGLVISAVVYVAIFALALRLKATSLDG